MLDPRGLDGLLHVLVLGLGVGPRRPLLPLAADGRDEGGADIAHEVGGHGGGGGGRRHQQQLRAPGQSQLRQFWSSVIEQQDLGAIQALSKVSKFIDKQILACLSFGVTSSAAWPMVTARHRNVNILILILILRWRRGIEKMAL